MVCKIDESAPPRVWIIQAGYYIANERNMSRLNWTPARMAFEELLRLRDCIKSIRGKKIVPPGVMGKGIRQAEIRSSL